MTSNRAQALAGAWALQPASHARSRTDPRCHLVRMPPIGPFALWQMHARRADAGATLPCLAQVPYSTQGTRRGEQP